MGDDERERVIADLRRRGAAGWLAPAEVEDRVRRAQAMQTKAGLGGLLADLPPESPDVPGPWAPPPPGRDGLGASVTAVPGTPRGWRLLAVLVAGAASLVLRVAAMGMDGEQLHRGRDTTANPDGETTTTTRVVPALPVTTDRVVAVPGPAGVEDPVLLKVGRGAGQLTPGLYTHTAVGDCTWERRDFDGRPEERRTAPRLLIEVIEYEQLYSEGCGSWFLYAAPDPPATSVGDGDWLVGHDMPVGRYRSSGPAEGASCRWLLANGFRHQSYERVTGGYARVPSEAQLPTGYRFTSTGCGTWTFVE